jgi:hypothetical protein
MARAFIREFPSAGPTFLLINNSTTRDARFDPVAPDISGEIFLLSSLSG